MSRGPGAVQRAITDRLAEVRTSEPWPPFLTARSLAQTVYGVVEPTHAQLVAVRRACQRHPGVDTVQMEMAVPVDRPTRQSVARYVAVASLAATPAEHLLRMMFHQRPGSGRHLLVNAVGYEAPPPGDLAESLCKGAADGPICRADTSVLAAAASLVNTYSGTAHTAAGLLGLHAEASTALAARWGTQRWCCAPDRGPVEDDEIGDIGAQWAALGG
ncbi:hypothetical protein ACIG5E_34250 [Kitasatospora sp. NPDC053057]|uniref:hypothetical protein n=1 Tax=Kitasatospora sp. NPDC053057 TaxID=3364062 RepID=UPI0037C8ED8B